MKRFRKPLAASLLLLGLAAAPHPVSREWKTVDSAAEVVRSFSDVLLRAVPRAMLHDAAGVAVVPHIVKAGLVISERFGRGVVVVHEPDGRWSNPLFITLSGGGIGGQVGIEKTDLILVFKTRKSLDRALRGKLTLGGDVTVAAGPVGRDAEAASDRFLRAEIFSWSHSRGLFAGVSLEGARLQVDGRGNEAFYAIHGCRPEHVFAYRTLLAPAERLKEQLYRLAPPPAVVPSAYKEPYGRP